MNIKHSITHSNAKGITNKRILVVEDSITHAYMLKRKITQHLPVTVTVAGTFAEAKKIVENDTGDIFLAVLDLNLPDASGDKVVDYILSKKITTIVLTGIFSEELRERMISRNVVDYIVKESVNDIDYIVNLINRIQLNQTIKLLVVDDSATARETIKQHLISHKFQVLIASNGEEAIKVMEKNPDVKLVITDFDMPKMDGFELVSEIRKSNSKEDVVIIGLSGHGSSAMSAKFLKKGANDFLYKPFSKEELFWRINQNIELMELFRKLKESSNRDYLTKLYNRRYFFETGAKTHENALRGNLKLSIAMIDLDHFKNINDTLGHDAGDEALKCAARLLEENLRKADMVARFGGEEFCAMAVGLDASDSAQLFERVRQAMEEKEIDYEGKTFHVTASIGVTTQLEQSLESMISTADAMLYKAKKGGRNRVVIDKQNL